MSPSDLDAAFDHYEAGEPALAEAACRRALERDPGSYGALYLLGTLRGENGDRAEGVRLLRQATRIAPEKKVAWFNLAVLMNKEGLREEALEALDRFIAIVPDDAEAHRLKGSILVLLRRCEEALASGMRAAALDPKLAQAHMTCADALLVLDRTGEALERFRTALALAPDDADANAKMGLTLNLLERFEDAAPFLEKAGRLNPAIGWTRGALLDARAYVCEWRDWSDDVAALQAEMAAGAFAGFPLGLMFACDDPALLRACAQTWAQANNFPTISRTPAGRSEDRRRIRVGYFSSDLREHPVGMLIAPILEAHDREKFEITAFSFGADTGDAWRRRLERAVDRFIDARDMRAAEIARAAQDLSLDIAVDLNGVTTGARTDVFSHWPAPVQVNMLGFPGTLANAAIDYIIADRIVIPPGEERHYSEKVVRLPGGYFPVDRAREVSARTFTRAQFGLPEKGPVFCCFNSVHKITPTTFDSWMRILRASEDGVLWLSTGKELAQRNLRAQAQARGVDPRRLVFATRVDFSQHLARHRLADLFLDTHPYNAHTTAGDALVMGLPVVTLAGGSFHSRVAASLLTHLGAGDLVAHSLAEYEALAIGLVRDRAKLDALRTRIAAAAFLFDPHRYVRELEAAFAAMVARADAGLPPADIDVDGKSARP